MRILHICLANFYIDNYTYQENLLPRMHKRLGHEVMILASTETYVNGNGKKLGYIKPSEYINEDGIPVKRIPYVSWLPAKLAHKLRIYPNVYESIEEFKPDFIFMHETQTLSLNSVIKYVKDHKIRIVADCHADFSNSARTFLSRWLLHGLIYKPVIKKAEPTIERFYGTLPARVDFLRDVYKLPAKKIDFLPMGVDDGLVQKYADSKKKVKIRKKFGFNDDDFLIVTGGKIDLAKTQTLLLMKAINKLNKENKKITVKLLVFGSVVDALKEEFNLLLNDNIVYAGWATEEDAYKYFSIADLVVFPGRHSVYWEQAAGLGKPLIVKHWAGTTHVDLGGNVVFLYKDSEEEIFEKVSELLKDKKLLNQMRKVAESKGKDYFSYLNIAKRCLK